jgi:DNA-binding GntR family transcriptional regulator
LGVSRTPVNIALSILAKEGFMDFVPNQGYTVHKITREEAEALYEIISIFSRCGVPKAIRGLTPEKLLELEKRKTEYEKAVADRVSRGRFILDQEFHAYLLEMSDNYYLADYFREVYQRIFLRHRIESLRPHRALQVVREHNEIFAAVRQKDVELAKKLIESHIEAGKDYIFRHIFDEAEGF